MGRESRVAKLRQCKVCKEDTWMSAEELKDHVNMCNRMKLIGFEMPTITASREPLILLPSD